MTVQQHPSRRRHLLVGLVVLVAGGLVAMGWVVQQRQRQLEQMQRQQTLLPRRIAALGRVEPLDRVVNLSVPSSLSNDAVRQVLVKEGQTVRKDQALAILDSAESLEKSVRQAAAAVTVAQRKLTAQESVIPKNRGELSQAEVELRRYRQLYDQGASSAELRDRRATILNTANGLPQVNIQTPSAAGVSLNQYKQFDVNNNGAILNNARLNTIAAYYTLVPGFERLLKQHHGNLEAFHREVAAMRELSDEERLRQLGTPTR
jgi:multidrug efflux pump subunit AcrA (membrane-fusion protein)